LINVPFEELNLAPIALDLLTAMQHGVKYQQIATKISILMTTHQHITLNANLLPRKFTRNGL
jgi:hypothetical protein